MPLQVPSTPSDFQSDTGTMQVLPDAVGAGALTATADEAETNLMETKVLIVEDDLEINELLGEYLSLENITYVQATTGQGGIYQAKNQHPDAMILDLMLPDIDGFEVARALTTKRATFDIPIVILSCMCQKDDMQKGFSSGALFYMNKPFLPDDLLTTLRQALEWKQGLKQRVPAGTITLGGADTLAAAKEINQMAADIFCRTDLTDEAVAKIRGAIETLGQWTDQWNTEHKSAAQMVIDYVITPGANGGEIEWEVSETTPALLASAFFKPLPAGQPALLNGWGTGSLMVKPLSPIAPPAQWLELLAKTGAARFEKDSKAKKVRFSRGGSGAAGSVAQVPVVDIDGHRYPTRLRGEALAARSPRPAQSALRER